MAKLLDVQQTRVLIFSFIRYELGPGHDSHLLAADNGQRRQAVKLSQQVKRRIPNVLLRMEPTEQCTEEGRQCLLEVFFRIF